MRAIWSGALSFGLINIPVKLYSGIEESRLDIDLLHDEDQQPIRYARVCSADGAEVPYEHVVKGIAVDRGFYVVLTKEDFQNADARKTNTIDIVSFTQEKEVPPVYYDRFYYLEPGKGAGKAYRLFLEALEKSKKVGIATFVLRQREHLAIVKPFQSTLILHQLRFHEQIRDPGDLELPKGVKLGAKESEMALSLIDSQTEKFDPTKFHDEYTRELQHIVEMKARGEKPKKVGRKPQPTEVNNLIKMLQKSLQESRKHGQVKPRR